MHRQSVNKPHRLFMLIRDGSARRQAPVSWLVGAILIGSPLSAWADPWWKWNAAPASRASTSPAPRAPQANGFTTTIHRLREEARQKAYAGDIDGALAAAQRARKIAEASAGLVGDDPECTVEAANELVRKLMAIKMAAAKPAPPRPAAAEGLSSAPQHASTAAALPATTAPPGSDAPAPIAVRPYGGAASLAEPSVVLTSSQSAGPPARPFPSWERPLTPFVPHPVPRVVKPLPPVAWPTSPGTSETNPVDAQPAQETSWTDDTPSTEETIPPTVVEPPPRPAEIATAAGDAPHVDVSATTETEFVSEARQTAEDRAEDVPPPAVVMSAHEESDTTTTVQTFAEVVESRTGQAQPAPQPSASDSDQGVFTSSPEELVTNAAWTTDESDAAAIATTSLEATTASSAEVPRTDQIVDHPAVSWEIPAIWFREVAPSVEKPSTTGRPSWRSWADGILPLSPSRTWAVGLAGLGLLLMGLSCFPTRRE